MKQYEWHADPPKENGDFYYSGKTPSGEKILAIVQITTAPNDLKRYACVFIPPGWRGDMSRTESILHAASLEKWSGEWAGPEYGLTAVEACPFCGEKCKV